MAAKVQQLTFAKRPFHLKIFSKKKKCFTSSKHLFVPTSVSTHCFTSMGAPVMSSTLYWMLVMDLSVLLMIPTIVTYRKSNPYKNPSPLDNINEKQTSLQL